MREMQILISTFLLFLLDQGKANCGSNTCVPPKASVWCCDKEMCEQESCHWIEGATFNSDTAASTSIEIGRCVCDKTQCAMIATGDEICVWEEKTHTCSCSAANQMDTPEKLENCNGNACSDDTPTSCCNKDECDNDAECEYMTENGPCVCNEDQCSHLATTPETCYWDSNDISCTCADCASETPSVCEEGHCKLDRRCAFIGSNCICNAEQCGATANETCSWNPLTKECVCHECSEEVPSACGPKNCDDASDCTWNSEYDTCVCNSDQCQDLPADGDGVSCEWTDDACNCNCTECTEGEISCCDNGECDLAIDDSCFWHDVGGVSQGPCICNDVQCQAVAGAKEVCVIVDDSECNCSFCDSCITESESCCNQILCDADTRCLWDTNRCICNQDQCDGLVDHPGKTCDFNSNPPTCECTCTDCTAGDTSCCDGNGSECDNYTEECFYDTDGDHCLCSNDHCQSILGEENTSCFSDPSGCICYDCEDCGLLDASCCNEKFCGDEENCFWEEAKGRCVCNDTQCKHGSHPGEECTMNEDEEVCDCKCKHCKEGEESCCDYPQCIQDDIHHCFWDFDGEICVCSDEQCDKINGDPTESCKFTNGSCHCRTCSDCTDDSVSCCNEPKCAEETEDCYWEDAAASCICTDEQCTAYQKPSPGEVCEMSQENDNCTCTCDDCSGGATSCCGSTQCGDDGCVWDAGKCFCTDEQCHEHFGTPATLCSFTESGCVCDEECAACSDGDISCCHKPKCEEAGMISNCFYDDNAQVCICTPTQCEAQEIGGMRCHIAESDDGDRSCDCQCRACNSGSVSCCDETACVEQNCDWDGNGCACSDEQCLHRDAVDGGAWDEVICSFDNGSCDCSTECKCEDDVMSCCGETLCGLSPDSDCYYDNSLDACICTQNQCEAQHEALDIEGIVCEFTGTSCTCNCEHCETDATSCCDENLCANSSVEECFWDRHLSTCVCSDLQCQILEGDAVTSCSIGDGKCNCWRCENCSEGVDSCCSSATCPNDCEWTGDQCICTSYQCEHYNTDILTPGMTCDIEDIGGGVYECDCECTYCDEGPESCCDRNQCLDMDDPYCHWDETAASGTGACFCTAEQCEEEHGDGTSVCDFVERRCECDDCADCSGGMESCCNEKRCTDDQADSDCYWGEHEELCICTKDQCEILHPDAHPGEECDIFDGVCKCVCTSCDASDVSCCGQVQCEEEGAAHDSDCHWTFGETAQTFGCFCNDSQCQNGFGDSGESCTMDDGQCVCEGCGDCTAGAVSCCNKLTCEEFGDPCHFDEDFDSCICNDEQCQEQHGEQLPGFQCEHDVANHLCECSCKDCTASAQSCCSSVEECICHGDEEECNCHWDAVFGRCFCTAEQCEEVAESGMKCSIEDVGCQCYVVTTTQPPDKFGNEFEGQMTFMDLFYNQLISTSAFNADFVRVAAYSTGASQHQFVRYSVHSFGDVNQGNVRRLLRGKPGTFETRTGIINDDSATEVFHVVDDTTNGVSASRIVLSLEEQVGDENSVFFKDFVLAQNATGAKLTYQVPEEEETDPWKIVAIVFVSLFAVLLLALSIWLIVRCCKPKPEPEPEPEAKSEVKLTQEEWERIADQNGWGYAARREREEKEAPKTHIRVHG